METTGRPCTLLQSCQLAREFREMAYAYEKTGVVVVSGDIKDDER